jgi:hypothetical protein
MIIGSAPPINQTLHEKKQGCLPRVSRPNMVAILANIEELECFVVVSHVENIALPAFFVGAFAVFKQGQCGVIFCIFIHNMTKINLFVGADGRVKHLNNVAGFIHAVDVAAIPAIIYEFVGVIGGDVEIIHIVALFAEAHVYIVCGDMLPLL